MAMNTTFQGTGVWNNPIVFNFRKMFYVVTPNESSFATVEEVPRYVENTAPYFIILIAVELIVNLLSGKRDRLPRWDDAYSSIAAGMMSLLPQFLMRNIEVIFYIYVYDNYAIYILDWSSPVTWWLSMFGVDFAYYWVHRCAHEINFMWAAHQVHHSSEEYNLSTALRQSVLQKYSSYMFYLPMAFFVPPSAFLVHVQFNLIYQFWIHTEVVDTLGPLEWVMNTPSHHRVHHGRNRYCIDKNYAGTFIIWDRMFGTFAKEEKKGEIAYGLVHPLASWDPIYTQLCHWKYILTKAWEMDGVGNKVSVFVKGPGWDVGKPRLGYNTDIPDVKAPMPKYERPAALWLNLYVYSHFAAVFVLQECIRSQLKDLPSIASVAVVLFIVWSLTNIGHFYEKKSHVVASELLRCIAYLAADAFVFAGSQSSDIATAGRLLMGLSAAFMLIVWGGKYLSDQRQKVE